MVRHPERVMTRSSYCIDQSIRSFDQLLRWYRGVGLCEYAVNPGVPVLQAYARWCMSHTNHKPIYERNYKQWLRKLDVSNDKITPTSRLSFEKAFGISIDTQIFIENSFDNLTITNHFINNTTLHEQALHSVLTYNE